jgi:hypothetical protein
MTTADVSSAERAKVCDDFATRHNLGTTEPLDQEMEGFYWLFATRDALQLALAPRSQELVAEGEPTWAILWTMLDRVYEHAEGSVVTFLTGTWASTEIIVRAVIEAAVNVMYVLQENTQSRLIQYLTFDFDSSRRQLNRGRDVSLRLKGQEAERLHLAVDRGLSSVKAREELLNRVLTAEGFSSTREQGWPKQVSARFQALGLEQDYCSIYAVLSSETHNDADSLVDYVIVQSFANPDSRVKQTQEFYNWIRYYVYFGLNCYMRAAEAYVAHYCLTSTSPLGPDQARRQIAAILDDIRQDLAELMAGA